MARRRRIARSPVVRRASLWFVPAVWLVGAFVLSGLTEAVDDWLGPGARFGAAADVREVLSTVATATATIIALVLSVTVLTLTVASSQFGPRLIRSFVRDRVTQHTIGLYLGTFLYSVVVLGDVSEDETVASVPTFGAGVSILLATACAVMLVVYAHRVARSIQVEQVTAGVAA